MLLALALLACLAFALVWAYLRSKPRAAADPACHTAFIGGDVFADDPELIAILERINAPGSRGN